MSYPGDAEYQAQELRAQGMTVHSVLTGFQVDLRQVGWFPDRLMIAAYRNGGLGVRGRDAIIPGELNTEATPGRYFRAQEMLSVLGGEPPDAVDF